MIILCAAIILCALEGHFFSFAREGTLEAAHIAYKRKDKSFAYFLRSRYPMRSLQCPFPCKRKEVSLQRAYCSYLLFVSLKKKVVKKIKHVSYAALFFLGPHFFFRVSLKGKVVKKIKHVSYAFKIEDFNISFAYFCFPFEPCIPSCIPCIPCFTKKGYQPRDTGQQEDLNKEVCEASPFFLKVKSSSFLFLLRDTRKKK